VHFEVLIVAVPLWHLQTALQVRFDVPEAGAAPGAALGAAPSAGTAQQQAAGRAPLLVALPVLPSGTAEGRPGTHAKAAFLPMPQPPAFSRLG